MTVGEMIEKLNMLDPELTVGVMGEGNCNNIEIIDYSGTPELKPHDNPVLIFGE